MINMVNHLADVCHALTLLDLTLNGLKYRKGQAATQSTFLSACLWFSAINL